MKLLVVEDEPKMARMLQRGLSEEGHEVDVCLCGTDGVAQARATPYDVLVLDWSLPDLDGVTVLRTLRAEGCDTPVLMLTARGTIGERVTGLRAGADDYLIKPFNFDELLARLEALSRRSRAPKQPTRRLGSAELDLTRRELRGQGGVRTLTAREFALANEFFSRPGEVLTREVLLDVAWGAEVDRTRNLVDVYVGYLRAKLVEIGASDLEIRAVRGQGYRLSAKA